MGCMSIKKVLAVIVMVASLFAIFAGIPYINNYTSQYTTQNQVFSESLVIPVDDTGYMHVKLNGTEADYYSLMTVKTGPIRGAVISPEAYAAWVNGAYKPQWIYEQPEQYGGYWEMFRNGPAEMYYVFWNPDAPCSREVTLKICEQTTETIYNYTTLGTGIFLIAAGAVAGSVAAYILGRRLLFTVIAFTLIIGGAFLITNYPQYFEGRETVATESFTVPAHSSINTPIHYNTTDSHYFLTLSGPQGRLNTSIVPESEWTAFTEGKYEMEYWQEWRGSHYHIDGLALGDMSARDVRLVLVNPEAFDEQVDVQMDQYWVGTDYSGTVGGIILVAFGIVVLYFTHRRQMAEFNRALENQE